VNKATVLPEEPQKIWINPPSDKSCRDVCVAGKDSFTIQQHGSWQNRFGPAGPAFTDIRLGFSSPHGMTSYAASEKGAFLSRDGTATWTGSANCCIESVMSGSLR